MNRRSMDTQQQPTVPNSLKADEQKAASKPQPLISKKHMDEPPQSTFIPLQLFYNTFHYLLVYLSKLVVGQWIISVFDYFVQKLEKTLKYSLPEAPNATEKPERPLNWFVFLPLLVVLRVLRLYLSVFTILLGHGEITALQMLQPVEDFRNYYRSVRHFSVVSFNEQDSKVKAERCQGSIFWQLGYFVFEMVIATKPPTDTQADLDLQNKSTEGQAKAPKETTEQT